MQKRNVIAISVLLVILLTLAFYQTPLMRHARQYTWNIWVRSAAGAFGIGRIDFSPDIARQMANLRAENVRLRAQAKDYNRLRAQLATPSFDHFEAVPAAVVSRPLDTFRSQYVINKGVQDGIVLGAPVVTSGSVLVGFITELNERSAVFQSLLHPATQLTAEAVSLDEGLPAARGLLQSRHYASLILSTVPRDVPLQEHQEVVSVSKDLVIPYGLLIGTVSSVVNIEHEPYQEARLALPYDIDSLDAVHVLAAP